MGYSQLAEAVVLQQLLSLVRVSPYTHACVCVM
jgi:hypothetical protein